MSEDIQPVSHIQSSRKPVHSSPGWLHPTIKSYSSFLPSISCYLLLQNICHTTCSINVIFCCPLPFSLEFPPLVSIWPLSYLTNSSSFALCKVPPPNFSSGFTYSTNGQTRSLNIIVNSSSSLSPYLVTTFYLHPILDAFSTILSSHLTISDLLGHPKSLLVVFQP